MADALHRDDCISYPPPLEVPHHTFDPTMHLCMKSMTHTSICELCPLVCHVTASLFIIQHNKRHAI